MILQQTTTRLNLLLLSVLLFTNFVTGDDCTTADSASDCPDDMYEVYEQDGTSYCCVAGTDAAQKAYHTGLQCQTTGCNAASSFPSDQCADDVNNGYILETSVNGTSLNFVKLLEEECPSGINVACCPVDTGDWFATALATQPRQFPHEAYLILGGSLCSGTIYNSRYIITASHCVVDKKSKPVNGKLQTKSLSSVVSYLGSDIAWGGDQYQTEEIHVHPDSTLLIPHHKIDLNDIAIIKVNRDIQFGEKVKALPIAESGFEPLDHADHVVIIGFGDTDTLVASPFLQRGNAILRPNKDNLSPHKLREYNDKFIFVGGIQNGVPSVTTGKGDSGGPGVCRDANGYATLCGLDSFGGEEQPCEDQDADNCTPKYFVRVSTFHDWIVSVAGDQSDVKKHLLRQPLYGKKVDQGSYQHQVHITSNDGDSCGGTLISKDAVLTAAHCVAKDDGSGKGGLKVVTGVRDLGNTLGGSASYDVASVKVLEGFGRVGHRNNNRPARIAVYAAKATSQDNFFRNDLAVVKLNGQVDISDFPSLASASPSEGGPKGAVEVALPLASNKQQDLAERRFNILEHRECKKWMRWLGDTGVKVEEGNVLCGQEDYTGGSLCDRELGGGLFCGGELCGVQTFRMCDFAYPTAFFNVAANRSWIQNAM